MKRRRAQKSPVGFSLFPFLAVLVCTMGALIVLLVVIAVQAKAESTGGKQEEVPPEMAEDLEIQREMFQLRIEQLTEQRRKTEEDLAVERRDLSHIEHHMQELARQKQELDDAAKQFEELGEADDGRRDELARRLAQLHDEIAETNRRLDEARRYAAARPKSYAVVPFKGPSGTNRRPIYIECRADSVVIQPEGIVLTEEDFLGPLGPGNPLAAAVRAASEYLTETGQIRKSDDGEAYPLLLVRPDGIRAYYAARKALGSWASEFGYELVEEDWNLKFERLDPRREAIEKEAIAVARERQKLLARAAPSAYGNHSRPRFRASPTGGGFVVEDEDGGSRSASGGFGSSHDVDRSLSSGRFDGGSEHDSRSAVASSGSSEWTSGDGGDSPKGGDSDRQRSGGERNWALPEAADNAVALSKPLRVTLDADELTVYGSGNNGEPKRIALGSEMEDSVYEIASVLSDEMETWGPAGTGMCWRPVLMTEVTPDGAKRYQELESLLADSGVELRPRWAGGSSDQASTGPQGGRENPSHANGQAAHAPGNRYSENASDQGQSPAEQSGSRFSPANNHRGAKGSASQSLTQSPSASDAIPPEEQLSAVQTSPLNANLNRFGSERPLSDERGQDWALPEEVRGAVPLTRPIRIVCRARHLAVLSDDPRRPQAHVIPLGFDTARSVDELVSVLWKRVDRWGTPGNGMYWRPTIVLEVPPDGRKPAAELESLLRDSGLELRVSYVNPRTAPPPPPRAARR